MCLLGLQAVQQRGVWGREVQLEGVRAAHAAAQAFPHTHATLLQDLAALVPPPAEGTQETSGKDAGERAEAAPAAEADERAVGATDEMKLTSSEGSLSDDAMSTSDGNGTGASAVRPLHFCADATGAGDGSRSNRTQDASQVRQADQEARVACVLQHVYLLCDRVHVALGKDWAPAFLWCCGPCDHVLTGSLQAVRLRSFGDDRTSCGRHRLPHKQCPLTCIVVVHTLPS